MRLKTLVIVAISAIALSVASASAAEYIGIAKCKMCHKLQYTSWEKLKHAKAFDLLKGDEQSNAECLKCHATGDSADLPNVQCEACHGPGSEYKSMSIMKDKDKAIAAGLVLPTEKTCLGCHTGAPHEQPKFNYQEAVKEGVHEHKAAS